MTLNIISTDEILFTGDVNSVTLPGVLGNFTVLNNHASLISVLTRGNVVYKLISGKEQSIDVKGGIADVDNNIVSVCVY